MYIFLITFLLLYGSMHCYAFFKLRSALQFRPQLKWLLVGWLIVMTVIPLLVRMAEQFKMEKIATLLAWPGYLWMGFLFIFCSTLSFFDIVRYTYYLLIRNSISCLPSYISTINSCRSALILAFCASIFAFIEAGRIRTDHLTLSSSKLPPAIDKIRIVQISDLHIGLLLQEERLQRIVEKVRETKPDILVSTGDLVDGKLNRNDAISGLHPMATLLAEIVAPSGKFAVIGNHEVYAGLPQALDFSRAAGFTILRNQSAMLACGITVSGVDDQAVHPITFDNSLTETTLLRSVLKNTFHLLLKHRPDVLPESDGLFDLQLSGHVHDGQIFPFNFLVRIKYPVPCGTTTMPTGSLIHVSRGTGTWGPPMRLFAPPEITIIDIVRR